MTRFEPFWRGAQGGTFKYLRMILHKSARQDGPPELFQLKFTGQFRYLIIQVISILFPSSSGILEGNSSTTLLWNFFNLSTPTAAKKIYLASTPLSQIQNWTSCVSSGMWRYDILPPCGPLKWMQGVVTTLLLCSTYSPFQPPQPIVRYQSVVNIAR